MRLRHTRHNDRAPSCFLSREQRKSLFIDEGRGKPGRIAVAAHVRLDVVLRRQATLRGVVRPRLVAHPIEIPLPTIPPLMPVSECPVLGLVQYVPAENGVISCRERRDHLEDGRIESGELTRWVRARLLEELVGNDRWRTAFHPAHSFAQSLLADYRTCLSTLKSACLAPYHLLGRSSSSLDRTSTLRLLT